MVRRYFAIGLLLLGFSATGDGQSKLPSKPAEPTLSGTAGNSIPFHLRGKGFMMVEGSVNGVAGEFMFDMGTPFSFFLNDSFLNLGTGKVVGHGSAGSGQQIAVMLHDHVDSLTMAGGIRFDGLREVKGTKLAFVSREIPVPSLLGFAGRALVEHRDFLIDYDALTITSPEQGVRCCSGAPEAVVRFDPKEVVPSAEFHAGEVPVNIIFDTGSVEGAMFTKEARRELLRKGLLVRERGSRNFTLKGLRYQDVDVTLHGLLVTVGEKNEIDGYMFLKNFRSLWSYRDGTITLWRRSGAAGSRGYQ